MALATSTIATASLVLGAVSTAIQYRANIEAEGDREDAAKQQEKARAEQKAAQAAQAAAERRQQIREERIKRARLVQSSIGTGVSGSSGEMGAGGSLATQLSSNIGFNLGQERAAAAISGYNQSAADFLSSASSKVAEANQWGAVAGMSMNIFDKTSGFTNSMTQAPAPVEIRVPTPVGQ